MSTQNEQRIPVRKAFLEMGSIYALLGIVLLGVRSVLRVWVDSYKMDAAKGEFILPYGGELLLIVAIISIGTGALLICMHYSIRNNSAVYDAHSLRSAVRLTVGAFAGIAATGLAQAWLHVGRLAIRENWMHPRSLVITSIAALVAGAVLFYLGSRRENL